MAQLVDFDAKDVGIVAEAKDVGIIVFTKDSGVILFLHFSGLLSSFPIDFVGSRYGNVNYRGVVLNLFPLLTPLYSMPH